MKKIYIDMDGVLCDFEKAVKARKTPRVTFGVEELLEFPQSKIGFFLSLEPIEGALESVARLSSSYDVWILSRPSYYNPHCYTEKALWVKQYLGFEMQKKLILAGDKSLLIGDYLIDDKLSDGQDKFKGKLIRFGSEEYPSWEEVVSELLALNNLEKITPPNSVLLDMANQCNPPEVNDET